MVIVERDRCGYCGGCVSVCPTGALYLAETRLLVDEALCRDCGLCVSACPVGALHLEDVEIFAPPPWPLKRDYDVVVVGAGPGGSVAAWTAAEQGLSVLLLEKRQEIGSPVRCAEGVAHDSLVAFIEPDPAWIAAAVDKAEFTLLSEGRAETTRAEGGQGYILERRVFDRVLAERAALAGAQVMTKAAATGLLLEDGVVRGVRVSWQGQTVEVACRVVVGADGIESRVGAWAGLPTTLPLRETMSCAQYLLAGVEVDPTCCAYYLGMDIAPGGYAWVFPKGEGRANVGLGVQGDLVREPPLTLLERFIANQPHLRCGYPVTLVVGGVPVAPTLPRLVGDGCLLVGDAARQVDPLTGGGIINAMTAGRLAGEVVAEAIAAGDVSAERLATYEDRWRKGVGRRMARNYRLKERFRPEERASRAFLRVFAVAAGGK